MVQSLKDLLLKNRVIDIAVAIVTALVFWQVVSAVMNGLVSPLIAIIFGKPNLAAVMNFDINHAHFSIGAVLEALVTLVLVVLALHYLVSVPLAKAGAAKGRDAHDA